MADHIFQTLPQKNQSKKRVAKKNKKEGEIVMILVHTQMNRIRLFMNKIMNQTLMILTKMINMQRKEGVIQITSEVIKMKQKIIILKIRWQILDNREINLKKEAILIILEIIHIILSNNK